MKRVQAYTTGHQLESVSNHAPRTCTPQKNKSHTGGMKTVRPGTSRQATRKPHNGQSRQHAPIAGPKFTKKQDPTPLKKDKSHKGGVRASFETPAFRFCRTRGLYHNCTSTDDTTATPPPQQRDNNRRPRQAPVRKPT